MPPFQGVHSAYAFSALGASISFAFCKATTTAGTRISCTTMPGIAFKSAPEIKRRKCERARVRRDAAENHLHDTPDNSARDHSDQKAAVQRADGLLFEHLAVHDAAYKSVCQQLKRHSDGDVERRHAEHHHAQQRGDKAHNRAHRAAAYEACKQNRQVHRTQHCADLRDMPGEERQY